MKPGWYMANSRKMSTTSTLTSALGILQIGLALSTFASCSSESSSSFGKGETDQKIRKGDPSIVVAVAIPDKPTVDMSFPNLKFVNDSSEFHDEDERITTNGTMISGVARKFGKRSLRAYPVSSQMMVMNGGNPYHTRSYNRYNRFDNRRNSLDSIDGSSTWGGKWFNQLKRRTGMIMSPMTYDRQQQQMYQNQEGTAEEPEMAATFLGSGGGGGGYGQSGHYGKAGVNKSAVGLLGFLSLLSLIQNVLNQTSMMGRRKRDVSGMTGDEDFQFGYDWDDSISEITLLTPELLPMMNAVRYAQNGQIPVECTLKPICFTNKALVDKFGSNRGKAAGQMISESLSKRLRQIGWRWKASGDWDIGGRVVRAGISGRNGKQCGDIFKDCDELARLPQRYSPNSLTTAIWSMRNLCC